MIGQPPMSGAQIIQPKSPQEIEAAKAIEDQKKIADEQKKRFDEIANKVAKVLAEEKVIVSELPSIVSILTQRVNNKMNTSEIDKILRL